MRTPMRFCDECKFAEMKETRDSAELRCAHNHKPPFIVPTSYGDVNSGEWGWMRRCRDYQPSAVELKKVDDKKHAIFAAEQKAQQKQWNEMAEKLTSSPA